MDYKELENEVFHLISLKLMFDVSLAKKIVGFPYASYDRLVPVSIAARSLPGTEINKSHVKNTDIRIPVIIGTMASFHFLMDGHHRTEKAISLNKKVIPSYILTECETRQCAKQKVLFDKLNEGLPIPICSEGNFYIRF